MRPAARHLLPIAALLGAALAHANPAVYSTPGTPAPASTFTAAASGQLLAYYTGEAGGFTNLVGARINGKMSPLAAVLKSGDVVLAAKSPGGCAERQITLRCVMEPDPAQAVIFQRRC